MDEKEERRWIYEWEKGQRLYNWTLYPVPYNGRLAAHKDILGEQCIISEQIL